MILVMSLLMVASASIPFAQTKGFADFHFFKNQLVYIIFGSLLGLCVYFVPLRRIFRTNTAFFLLVLSLVLILYTVIAGSVINGSKRWIEFGGINFQ